ncbi:MAG: VanW family protein [bacterium]
MNRAIRLLGLMATISIIVAICFLLFDFFQSREIFPTKTYIGKVNVSGLTKEKANDKLRSYRMAEIFSPIITFEVEANAFSFSPEALGLTIDYGKSLDQAFALSHKESYIKDLKSRLSSKILFCPLFFKVNDNALKDVLTGLTPLLQSSPRNASFIFYEKRGSYHIENEELGREVLVDKTIASFKERLAKEEKRFPIELAYQEPAITAKVLREAPPIYRLSAFTTFYGRHDSPNRIHNIKLVASWVDNTILLPGQVFSVADILGDVTSARGFKEAYVILAGVLVPTLGGGSCQIATTLYNAAILADLKIVQRKNHSFYFNIYPLGRDAGVYPGQLDMKFENDTGKPILIKAIATNSRLSFRIYGTPTGKKVKLSSPAVFMKGKPATVKQVLAADLPFVTVIKKTVFSQNGKKINEEEIVSRYKLYGEKDNVPIARPEPR